MTDAARLHINIAPARAAEDAGVERILAIFSGVLWKLYDGHEGPLPSAVKCDLHYHGNCLNDINRL